MSMKIEIDENKILTEVLERDGQIHELVKKKVQEKLVNDFVNRIEDKYMTTDRWRDEKTVADYILRDLGNKQTELVKKILKDFYDSYRYKKSDLAILKELKKFIGEQD